MSGTAGAFVRPRPRCLACGTIVTRAIAMNGGAPAQMCDHCHEAAEEREVVGRRKWLGKMKPPGDAPPEGRTTHLTPEP